MREMGQSAWLNTSYLTIQGTEGKSQRVSGTTRNQATRRQYKSGLASFLSLLT